MKLLTYTIGYEEMRRKVKEETSHLAIRQADDKGRSLFETLVFHEGYDTLFRSYFNSATASIADCFATYTKYLPASADEDDMSDRELYEDYIVQLPMPPNWNHSYAKGLETDTSDYLMNYILARWLESKLPPVSQLYEAKMREAGAKIKNKLNRRIVLTTRPSGYF